MLKIMCNDCGSEMLVRGGFALANGGRSRACICLKCGKREVVEFNKESEIINRRQARQTPIKQAETLCWKCSNAKSTGCEWHRNFKPIKGWVVADGYCVVTCPQFVPDKK